MFGWKQKYYDEKRELKYAREDLQKFYEAELEKKQASTRAQQTADAETSKKQTYCENCKHCLKRVEQLLLSYQTIDATYYQCELESPCNNFDRKPI